MPLSSSSLPSLGGSKLDDIASPNLWRFAAFSASLDPNWAGGNERNMRPKRPWNNGDFGVDMSPRSVALCFALMRLFGNSSSLKLMSDLRAALPAKLGRRVNCVEPLLQFRVQQ